MNEFTPYDEKSKADHPPPGGEPSTAAPGDPPNSTKLVQKVNHNPLGKPKNSVFKRMSALARFRQSRLYQKLRQSKYHQDTQNADDQTFTPANLKERAEAMIEYVQGGGTVENLFRFDNGHKLIVESTDDFADAVIAVLIDAGLDDNLVEVETEGDHIIVYLDDRTAGRYKDVPDLLGDIAEVELVSKPDDNPDLGTYVYKVMSHGDDSHLNKIQALGRDAEKQESKKGEDSLKAKKNNGNGYFTGKQPDTYTKKGKRVMHDDNETFTPKDEAYDRTKRLMGVEKIYRTSKKKVFLVKGDTAAKRKRDKAANIMAKRGYKPESDDLIEDDFGMHDEVWVVYDGVPLKGTVVDIENFGGEWEQYHVRFEDGSMSSQPRGCVHGSRKEAVKKYNKYRTPEEKIESQKDPAFEEATDPLGSNPAPRKGDVYIDGQTRRPFRVTKVFGRKMEVEINAFGGSGRRSTQVLDTQTIEQGLTNGNVRRISREEAEELEGEVFTESKTDLHVCPNCVIPLVAEEDSFVCNECDFVAEFVGEPQA